MAVATKKKSKPKVKRAAPRKAADPTTVYARDVVAGKIVASRNVRLACERHLLDLVEGGQRGLSFDVAAAQLAIDFFETILCLNGGEFEGRPFILQPWQRFIVGCLFGWKGPDGFRRFRHAFIEIAKGNGKSPLAAGIGLLCQVADNEPRAEVYAAATKRDQAMILFRDAVAMVDQSPALTKRIQKTGASGREWNLAHLASGSFFRPIGSDTKSQSGPRPHCALIDEIHEHDSAVMVDMMRAGTKGRRQALIVEITNSGSDRASVCWDHHHYSSQILNGLADNDAWFAFLCGLDVCEAHRADGNDQPVEGCPDCDDWRDERVWIKANPNLGVSVSERYLREQVTTARGMPTAEGEVKRLNFCIWTQAATRCIPADRWLACARPLDMDSLRGMPCTAGFDIGATSDFTALVLLFAHDDAEVVVEEPDPSNPDAPPRSFVRRSYTAVPYFWLPQRPVRRDERTARMIDVWKRDGFIRVTAGDSVDYDQVLRDIKDIGDEFNFSKLAIDTAFQGMAIGQNLVAHFGSDIVYAFRQGILSFNSPFREFLELVKQGRLHHPNHPVLNWMAGNCAAEDGKGGLIKPSKDKSPEKIDGITAVVMALGVAPNESGIAEPEFFFMD